MSRSAGHGRYEIHLISSSYRSASSEEWWQEPIGQDNSEIGNLKNDAWTYWGHSGAPLLVEANDTLIGLHSPWDDEMGMRQGIPLVAIRAFLEQYAELMGSSGVANGDEARCPRQQGRWGRIIVLSD
ncbi:hypothetical protein FQN49_000806 [Arthroderma sp. PD_2]|nr:hypothetical protein FQN49_000806 [Arthroderma sp. PD_2]